MHRVALRDSEEQEEKDEDDSTCEDMQHAFRKTVLDAGERARILKKQKHPRD